MTPLIPDRMITFSPGLAATIGLEEAVLLQVLHDIVAHRPPMPDSSLPVMVQKPQLDTLLPFWSDADIERITQNLVNLGVIARESNAYTESFCLQIRFHDTAQPSSQKQTAQQPQSSIQAPQPSQPQAQTPQRQTQNYNAKANFEAISQNKRFQGRSGGAMRISSQWQPSEDIFLQLNQLNIDKGFAQAKLPEFITYWRDRGEVSYSWGAKFLKHVIREWQHHQNQTPFIDQSTQHPSSMSKGWQPSPDAMDILTRTGIDPGFIQDTIPEFVLYWQERGDSTSTWNSKFIRHIKQQWARFTHTLKHDSEPKPIANNWQPDDDVFDIIKLANIDIDFARAQVKEFVIYWRDSKQIHSSWNTKFLQHVKYRWANQHQFNSQLQTNQLQTGNGNAKWKQSDQSGHSANSSFVARYTDRSWADGL